MFIAHLPASYCLTTAILNEIEHTNGKRHGLYLRIGCLASILPDMDMIYFYLIDQRQHLHHSYWTHLPVFWISCSAGLLSLGLLLRKRTLVHGTLIGFANVMLHLLLDSFASKVKWMYPLSDAYFGLFRVPSAYGWWIRNYLCHWTFAIEVILVILAGCMFYYRKRTRIAESHCKGRNICRLPY